MDLRLVFIFLQHAGITLFPGLLDSFADEALGDHLSELPIARALGARMEVGAFAILISEMAAGNFSTSVMDRDMISVALPSSLSTAK
ncbi:MAG TPA: hypothetical protein VGH33_17850, partial [Isosphaeraceae bacterium]